MRRPIKVALTVAGFLALGLGPAESNPADKDHNLGVPTDLVWGPIGSLPPGAEMAKVTGDPAKEGPFTLRIRMPGDYEIPPHWHPVVENVTVISGIFHMGMGETLNRGQGTALEAGGYAVMQPEVRHYAWTSGSTVIQLHGEGPWRIHYVDDADDPRND